MIADDIDGVLYSLISSSSLSYLRASVEKILAVNGPNHILPLLVYILSFICFFLPSLLNIVYPIITIILPLYHYVIVEKYRRNFVGYFKITVVVLVVLHILEIKGTILWIFLMLYQMRLWYPNAIHAPNHWNTLVEIIDKMVRALFLQYSKYERHPEQNINSGYIPLSYLISYDDKRFYWILELDARLILTIALYAGILMGIHFRFLITLFYFLYTICLPLYLWWYTNVAYLHSQHSEKRFLAQSSHRSPLKATVVLDNHPDISWRYFAYIRIIALIVIDGVCGMSGFIPRTLQMLIFFYLYFPTPSSVINEIWEHQKIGVLGVCMSLLNQFLSFIFISQNGGDDDQQNSAFFVNGMLPITVHSTAQPSSVSPQQKLDKEHSTSSPATSSTSLLSPATDDTSKNEAIKDVSTSSFGTKESSSVSPFLSEKTFGLGDGSPINPGTQSAND